MRISDWSSDVCSSDLSKSSAAGGRRISRSVTRRGQLSIARPFRHGGRRRLWDRTGAGARPANAIDGADQQADALTITRYGRRGLGPVQATVAVAIRGGAIIRGPSLGPATRRPPPP